MKRKQDKIGRNMEGKKRRTDKTLEEERQKKGIEEKARKSNGKAIEDR